jgi:lambda family phage portal protein
VVNGVAVVADGDTKLNFLDRAIEWVSPDAGARRRLARMQLRQVERTDGKIQNLIGYREAYPTPRDKPVYARGASPDWSLELGFDRRDNVDIARQLERVNSIAGSVLDRACEHVIGEGFSLKCKTASPEWNKAAEEYWDEWCRTRADARGQMTFNEMLTIVFRSWLRDGDIGAMLNHDGSIRLVESDEIASKVGGYYKPSDADGVELDRNGRIIAFYIFDYDPNILWPDRRRAIPRLIRVPAEDMIFLARRQRAGQTRGISAFAGASWMFEQLDDIYEATAVAHHMAAAVGLAIYKKNAIQGTGRSGEGGEIKMAPGSILRLEPGEEVEQINPKHPGDTFGLLVNTLTRVCAARFGMSLELVNYDFTDANYSNMRAQSLETAVASRIKQRGMMTHFCSQAWGWVCANGIRDGKLRPRTDAWKHTWGISGSPWVDPEVELRAAMGSVDACLDTRRNILARRGLDFDEVAQELADENDKLRELGVPDIRSNLTRDAIPTTKSISDQPAGATKESKNGHDIDVLRKLRLPN